MGLKISSALLARLQAESAACANEVCGLLFGTSDLIHDAAPCRNVAADPATSFEIDPATLIAAHKAARGGGPSLTGHYHSHPGGQARPSPRDAAAAAPDGAIWLILAGDRATAWRAVASGEVAGRFDQVALSVV